MSRCIEMELTRFDITPDLQKALEPLILDALLEYALRHRSSQGHGTEPLLQLTLTQAIDVLAANQARWHKRLSPALATLRLSTEGLPRKVGDHIPALLRTTQEFFRREGAATLHTAAEAETADGKFSVLWTNFFSRCLLDWLRDQDLIGHPENLETADILVECTKLWIQELATLITDPPPEFTDTEREITATLERGPVRLRVRGRMEPQIIRQLEHGMQVVDFRFGDPAQAELHIARLLLYMMLIQQLKGKPCTTGRLICFRSRPARQIGGSGLPVNAEIEQALAPFIGNEPVVHRLKQKAVLARQSKGLGTPERLLISGPVGHGKTLLMRCYTQALGLPLVEFHSPTLTTPKDLIDSLNEQLQDQHIHPELSHHIDGRQQLTYPPLVLFFDDLQALRRRQDPWHGLLQHPSQWVEAGDRIAILSQATILAATQNVATLPEPVLARFQRLELDRYRHEDIARMVTTTLESHHLALPPALAHLIAVMGRCNPMRARLFATELRDRHRAHPDTTPLTRAALMHLATHHWHVDEHGLSARDYQYLQALESGPRGLPALQQLLPMQDEELTAHIEPYLLHIGAIRRNSRGRSITVLGEQLLHRHRTGMRA